MKNLILVIAGAVLLNELNGLNKLYRQYQYIGKIVDSKPKQGTPCLDGNFSTNIIGSGVCSWHGGVGENKINEYELFVKKSKFIKTARNLIIQYPEIEKRFDEYEEKRRWADGKTAALLDEKIKELNNAMILQADQGAKHLNMHVNDYLYLLDLYKYDGSVALNKELENIYNKK